MGNFEKLSVLVIGVIIVMILVVALYTWTDDPATDTADLTRPTDEGPQESMGETAEVDGPSDERWADSDWVDEDAGPIEEEGVDPLLEEGLDPDESLAHADDLLGGADPVEDPPSAEKTVTVKRGETLGHIAQRELGKAGLWKLIADRNNINDPTKVREGMVLVIPALERAAPADNKGLAVVPSGAGPKAGDEYTVKGGDTIQKIAQSAFGTIERWTDIWFANFERIEDPRFLRQGMKLTIPN